MFHTIVRNLDTTKNIEQHYTLPAVNAVICAYEQSLGNFNTWDYEIINHPKVVWSLTTVTCGDFCAFRDDLPTPVMRTWAIESYIAARKET